MGTTTPSAGLDVNRHMKVDSTLTVKDSVRIKSRLTVDEKVVFKDNLIVKGQLLRAYHNAKVNNNLTVDNKLTVDGISKLNGIVKMLGINNMPQQLIDSNNFELLLRNPNNGNVLKLGYNDMANLFGWKAPNDPVDDSSPCTGYNSNINQAAGWMYNGYKIFTCLNRVGINKHNPQTELDVNGTIKGKLIENLRLEAGNHLFNDVINSNLQSIVNIYGDAHKIEAGKIVNGVTTTYFKVKYDGGMEIKSENSSAPLVVRDINNNKLFQIDNNGLVHSREIKVDLNYANWPDYVFEKNYNLLSLEQIANYILKHKHLPGVPSAKEIETKGLSLGKMQTILMQKIEELTLYTITQNTQIKDLEKNVTQLEKENQQLKSDLQQMNDRLDKIEARLNHK